MVSSRRFRWRFVWRLQQGHPGAQRICGRALRCVGGVECWTRGGAGHCLCLYLCLCLCSLVVMSVIPVAGLQLAMVLLRLTLRMTKTVMKQVVLRKYLMASQQANIPNKTLLLRLYGHGLPMGYGGWVTVLRANWDALDIFHQIIGFPTTSTPCCCTSH